MDTENKTLKAELQELKREIRFLKKALLVLAFFLGGVIAEIIKITVG